MLYPRFLTLGKTFFVNSLNVCTLDSIPAIPIWHSYILAHLCLGGRGFLNSYLTSGFQNTPSYNLLSSFYFVVVIHAGTLYTYSPLASFMYVLTYEPWGITFVPSSFLGIKISQFPKLSGVQEYYVLFQLLKSPVRYTSLAPGAHSLYKIPFSLTINPYFSYPFAKSFKLVSIFRTFSKTSKNLPFLTLKCYLNGSR